MTPRGDSEMGGGRKGGGGGAPQNGANKGRGLTNVLVLNTYLEEENLRECFKVKCITSYKE